MPLIPQARLLLLIAISLTTNACTEAIDRSMNDPARDEWQQPTAVIKSLTIDPGARIAGLGAGAGYWTFPLAEATGPAGQVYVVDIDEESLRFVEQEGAQKGGLPSNIQLILASPDAANLPQNSTDSIFPCNTSSLARHLRQGGRIAIIDLKPRGWFWLFGHAAAKETVREEMTSEHFQVFAIATP